MRRKIGRLVGLVFLISVLGIASGALYTQHIFQEAFYVTWTRLLRPQLVWQKNKYPSLRPAFDIAERLLSRPDPRDVFQPISGKDAIADPTDWPPFAIGPQISPEIRGGAPEVDEVIVKTAKDLVDAVRNATPGDIITIAPGAFSFTGRSIAVAANGTDTAPITVRAKTFGTVTLQFNMQEGFHIGGANWIFENLVINGTCLSDSYCEHAFHVTGNAHSTIIRNNWISNFNASLKVNGARGRFPDDGRVTRNVFVNDRPRQTSNPVTLLDIVGASNWVVEANFIADFAKAQGDRVSYGAFFKGAGEDNLFERNLVRCEWRRRGGIRIGFSFGGGGTTQDACRDGECRAEHSRGIMRNNIVMNCPNDVGVYLNKSADTLIQNNLLIDTRGIDVRFPETTATIVNNVIDGRILARTEGRFTERGNIISVIDAALNADVSSGVFAGPAAGDITITDERVLKTSGTPVPDPARDFCNREYPTGHSQVGPFIIDGERTCITTIP